MPFKRRLFCLFLFVFSLSLIAQVKISTTPFWVDNQEYSTNIAIDSNEIMYGYVILLSDEQVNAKTQQHYLRTVKKITDNIGIQDAANIEVNYDPKYQTLHFHKIDIIRKGKTINKLNINDFQVIRKESNSESYIYDGRLTAMINLSDIRKDDILDFSYTVKGFNPIHKGNFSGILSLNNYTYMNKSHIRIMSPQQLDYKLFNSSILPYKTTVSGQHCYTWSAENVQSASFEDNTPTWLIEHKALYISTYKTWEDIVNWALPIYKVNDRLSPQLKQNIKHIKSKYTNDSQRIKATLEFVQNEIRYLGLEDGIGSYKPFSPNVVIKQRFGDCKDKALLMITMLKAMQIKAYPMLINTSLGQNLPELLPTPKAFDHVVVKVIDTNGHELYYDPTITNQKGQFDEIYFPDYGYGLVIKDDETELEQLQNFSSNLIEVYDTFELEAVGKGATLNVETVYYDYEADKMRYYYKNNSISTIKNNFKNYYTSYYDDIEPLRDPVIKDDSIANKITINEHYKLEEIWEEMYIDEDNISVTFSPTAIYDILMIPKEKTRTKAYSLYYPASKRHKIKVKLPINWDVSLKDITISSKDFYYDFEGDYNRSTKTLTLESFYKNQNSYVKPENFETYYKDIKRLENQIAYYIFIPKSYAASNSSFNSSSSNSKININSIIKGLFIYIVLPIVVIVILLIIFIARQNSKS